MVFLFCSRDMQLKCPSLEGVSQKCAPCGWLLRKFYQNSRCSFLVRFVLTLEGTFQQVSKTCSLFSSAGGFLVVLQEFLSAASFWLAGPGAQHRREILSLQWEAAAPSPAGSELQSGRLSSKILFLKYYFSPSGSGCHLYLLFLYSLDSLCPFY